MEDERSSTLGSGNGTSTGSDAHLAAGKDSVEGIVYPVEFELRVIYLLEAAPTLSVDLHKVLTDSHASPGVVRLPAPSGSRTRIPCTQPMQPSEPCPASRPCCEKASCSGSTRPPGKPRRVPLRG